MKSTRSLVHVSCSWGQNNFLFNWLTGRVDLPLEVIGIDSLPQLTWSSLSKKIEQVLAPAQIGFRSLCRFQYMHACTDIYIFAWLHASIHTMPKHALPLVYWTFHPSPMVVPYGHPYLKWVSNDTVSASNRASICETYFGLQQRHNPNMSILSPGDSFAERVLFWVLLLEKTKNRYGTLYLQRYPNVKWVLYFE